MEILKRNIDFVSIFNSGIIIEKKKKKLNKKKLEYL